jgi:hypothetical protein
MNRIPKRPVIFGALIGGAGLAVVILALSFSGGSGATAGTTTASPLATGTTSGGKAAARSVPQVSAAEGWHNLAQCFRDHGYSIADPTVNADGTSSWSSSTGPPPREVRNAERAVGEQTCGAEYHALPPQAVRPPPTQAEIQRLVLFSRCMRESGLADWPDPNATGAFPLNARLLALGKRGIINQMRACERHLPGNGISVAGPPKNG